MSIGRGGGSRDDERDEADEGCKAMHCGDGEIDKSDSNSSGELRDIVTNPGLLYGSLQDRRLR